MPPTGFPKVCSLASAWAQDVCGSAYVVVMGDLSEFDAVFKEFWSGQQAAQRALKDAMRYGTGIIFREDDGTYDTIDPLKVKMELLEPEEDHGEIVMLRFSYEGNEPQYIPPAPSPQAWGASVSDEDMEMATVIQGIHADGHVTILKNRYGSTSVE